MIRDEENIISRTSNQFLLQFEIDTVRLFIHWSNLKEYDSDYMKKISNAIQSKVYYVKGKAKYQFNGSYKGFKIKIADKGITIIGSFSNYYLDKVRILPYLQLKYAVDQLSRELNLDLRNAKLYRVDVNFNFITDQQVNKYTNNLFLDLPRYRRLEQGYGVKFKTKTKELAFYNKSLELEEKYNLKAENQFRIEYRILKDVKKYTKMEYLKDLFEPENYCLLLNQFFDLFNSIKKQSVFYNNDWYFKGLKEFNDYLYGLGIEKIGGEKEIFKVIDQFDKNDVFDNRQQKYRFKKKVIDLISRISKDQTHWLAREIEEKFEQAIQLELAKLNVKCLKN